MNEYYYVEGLGGHAYTYGRINICDARGVLYSINREYDVGPGNGFGFIHFLLDTLEACGIDLDHTELYLKDLFEI